jgi:hypothetical protein
MIDVEYHAMQQGSLDWHRIRMGCATASEFGTILAKGRGENGASKGRATYMYKLAGEILTEQPTEAFSNDHMLRGQMMEDEARDWYAMQRDVEPQRIGFLRAALGGAYVGASPDSLVGDDGLLEVKTRLPHLQIPVLMAGVLPDEHRAQVQGQLWLSGRAWCDYVSYWPKIKPLIVRVPRDEAYIDTLAKSVELFLAELSELVRAVRAL